MIAPGVVPAGADACIAWWNSGRHSLA